MSHLWFQKNKQCRVLTCFSLEQRTKINAVGAAHSSLLRMWELQFSQPSTVDFVLIGQDLQPKMERPVGQPRTLVCVQQEYIYQSSAHWKAQEEKIVIFQCSFLWMCSDVWVNPGWEMRQCCLCSPQCRHHGRRGSVHPPDLKTWGSSERDPDLGLDAMFFC